MVTEYTIHRECGLEGVYDDVTHLCASCGHLDDALRYRATVAEQGHIVNVRYFDDWYPAEQWLQEQDAPGRVLGLWDREREMDVLGVEE